MGIQKQGGWSKALSHLHRLSTESGAALQRVLLQEAHSLRKHVVEGLTQQAPGGAPMTPLAKLTLANRRLHRFYGSKALIIRGDLRNGIAVAAKRYAAFVGVLRNAISSDGQRLTDLGEVHEFGTDPIIIPVTPRMRRFLHVLFREAALPRIKRRGQGSNVIVMQVPPRPFLRPAYTVFLRGAAKRFRARLAQELRQ